MKVILISCVKRKRALAPGEQVAAKDLYTSPLFTKAWAYAQTLGADRLYILSAKYGLLRPDTPIATYDETLAGAPVARCKQWSAQVLEQLAAEGIDRRQDTFVLLAGRAYYKYLLGGNGLLHYELPYAGCGGMGYVLQFLSERLGQCAPKPADPMAKNTQARPATAPSKQKVSFVPSLAPVRKAAAHPAPVPVGIRSHSLMAVSEIANLIRSRHNPLPATPGIYRWWFDEEATRQILAQLPAVDTARIAQQTIEGQVYSCLYVGISKDLAKRIKWHTLQRHSAGTVQHGTISTLRHTIGSLLGLTRAASQSAVTAFLCDHCYLQWLATATLDEAETAEHTALSPSSGQSFPLNLKDNRTVPPCVIQTLSALRKKFN